MTLKIEQEINNFIKNIRILEIAKNGVEMLQYNAKCNDSKALTQFNQAYDLINDANHNLLISINNGQESGQIAKNIDEAIDIIRNIQDEIPNKEELIEMLEICTQSFSSTKIIDVFEAIKKNQSLFSKQILLLNEIWQSQ